MPIAVCLGCGAWKRDAFTPCASCGTAPTTETGRVRALLVSDHHKTRSELQEVRRLIRAGGAPAFDDQQVALLASLSHAEPLPVAIARRAPGALRDLGRLGKHAVTAIAIVLALALGIPWVVDLIWK